MKTLLLSPAPDPTGARARRPAPLSSQELFRRLALAVPGTREADRLMRAVRRMAERAADDANRLKNQPPRHE